jgi:hypothetical protein
VTLSKLPNAVSLAMCVNVRAKIEPSDVFLEGFSR